MLMYKKIVKILAVCGDISRFKNRETPRTVLSIYFMDNDNFN